jgi:uncharacterized protein (DUF427 family)
VLETAGAPVYYFPPEDVRMDLLERSERHRPASGRATRSTTSRGPRSTSANVAWSYPDPKPGYEAIRDHLAFYAGRVDEAWVGDEQATPQPGGFYGGWVTSKIVGPIKGEPGSAGW